MSFFQRLFGKKSPAPKPGPPPVSTSAPASSSDTREDYSFRWYEAGPNEENPFDVRLLDCRSLTQTVVAMTQDRSVSESYLMLRDSDGRNLIAAEIPDSVFLPVSLRIPHTGEPLDGIIFKAPSMDVKWDIYIYNSVFLFARSWTGFLSFRAFATVGPTEILIRGIECQRSDAAVAASHVYFLIATHPMRRVLPHQLPEDAPKEPKSMALMSFSLFGNLGCYATFEDITHIPITPPKAS